MIVYDLLRESSEPLSVTCEQGLLLGGLAHGQEIPQHLTAVRTLQHATIVLLPSGLPMKPLQEGAELRLMTSSGTSGHVRPFLPDTNYAPKDARVLRKVDGTGFFMFIPAAVPVGSRLASGQYRLKMTYRRDNRAIAPDSLVVSQAGLTAPEQVTIDIPWRVRT